MFSLPHPPHWKAGIYRGITDEARAWDIDKAGSEVAPDHQPRSGAFTLRLLKHSDRSFAHRLAVRNPLAKGQRGIQRWFPIFARGFRNLVYRNSPCIPALLAAQVRRGLSLNPLAQMRDPNSSTNKPPEPDVVDQPQHHEN